MKYAFNTWAYSSVPVCLPAYPLDEAIRRLAAIGYDGVEICCAAPHDALIGISLFLGLLTKWALFAGSLLTSIWIFGTCPRSDWATVGVQLLSMSLFISLAFLFLEYNQYSVDRICRSRKRE